MTRYLQRWFILFTGTLVLATGCAGRSLQARMAHGEEKASDAETMLDEAQKRLDEKNPDRAERLINNAEKTLADPDVSTYPERSLLMTRVGESRARLDAVRAELAWRAQEEKIDHQQRSVDEAVAKLRPAMALLKTETLSRDHFDEAEDAAETLQEQLNDGRPLEKTAPRYEQSVKPQWALLMDSAKELKFAAALLKFKEGPLESANDAQASLAEAKKKPKQDRLSLYEKAHEQFTRCRMDGSELLAQSPGIDKRTVLTAPGKITPVKTVLQNCATELSKLDKAIADAKRAAASAKAAAEKRSNAPKAKKKPAARSR